MLGIEFVSGFDATALAEAVGVESQDVVRQHHQLFICLSSFFHLESLFVKDNTEFVFDGVVLDHEEILHELLHDLTQGKLVNLAVRLHPADLKPDLLEDTLPINHVIELILGSTFVRLLLLVVQLGNDFWQVGHQERLRLLFTPQLRVLLQVFKVSELGVLRQQRLS